MRISLKKTLATVLSVALMLTTCMCALTVGAVATAAGKIDIFDNVNIESGASTFEVESTITLDAASEFVEVAFTLDLPTGFTLNSVVAKDASVATVAVDNNKVISVSARGPVKSIDLVMTIGTAGDFESANIGVAKVEFAEKSEADLTLDITDTGAVAMIIHKATATYAHDATHHWFTCAVEDCAENHQYEKAEHTYVDSACVCGAVEEVVCDHANATVKQIIELAQGTSSGQTAPGRVLLTCPDCGVEYEEETSYYYYYSVASTAADLASEISLIYNVRDDLLARQGDYSSAFVYYKHQLGDEDATLKETMVDISETVPTVVGSSQRPGKAWYYGIKSTQMTEAVAATVFVKVNGTWYNGYVKDYSIRTYADSRLAATNDVNEKTVLVNMLRYGSKMQTYKGYNLLSMADAGLGSNAQYITETEPEMKKTVENKYNTSNSEVIINKFVLDMSSKIETNLYFRSDFYKGTNKDDYLVRVDWTNAKGTELYQEFKNTADDENNIKAYGPEMQNGQPRANRYTFIFDGLASYDMRQDFTVSIYDGETKVNCTYEASVEALISSGIAAGTYQAAEKEMLQALLNYSDASSAYFAPPETES